jgi:hypothetical protein
MHGGEYCADDGGVCVYVCLLQAQRVAPRRRRGQEDEEDEEERQRREEEKYAEASLAL